MKLSNTTIITLTILILFISFLSSLMYPSHTYFYPNHKICYYPLESECGQIKYCASHVTQDMCIHNKGVWEWER
jgi:hypothetical protein